LIFKNFSSKTQTIVAVVSANNVEATLPLANERVASVQGGASETRAGERKRERETEEKITQTADRKEQLLLAESLSCQ